MYEVTGPSGEAIISALKKAADKMPIKSKIIIKS
jgi:ribosomal protein L16/L10AE